MATTTKDTAYLTFHEETTQHDDGDSDENSVTKPPNNLFTKLVRILFHDKPTPKPNNFNLDLSNTEINPDQRYLSNKDNNPFQSQNCFHLSYRNNEKRKIVVISGAVIILFLTVIAIIILASKSFEKSSKASLIACITTGGPAANKSCIFPFTHKGKTYKNCTLDGDSSGGAWCSTSVDAKGNHVGGCALGNLCSKLS